MKWLSAWYKYLYFPGNIWNWWLAVFAWQGKVQQNQAINTPSIASPTGPLGTGKETLLVPPLHPWQVFCGSQCYWQILVREFHILPFGVIIPTPCQSASGSVLSLEAHVEKSLSSPVTEGYRRKTVLFIEGLLLQFVFFMERNKIRVWQSITTVRQHTKHFTTDQGSCS